MQSKKTEPIVKAATFWPLQWCCDLRCGVTKIINFYCRHVWPNAVDWTTTSLLLPFSRPAMPLVVPIIASAGSASNQFMYRSLIKIVHHLTALRLLLLLPRLTHYCCAAAAAVATAAAAPTTARRPRRRFFVTLRKYLYLINFQLQDKNQLYIRTHKSGSFYYFWKAPR